MANPSDPPVIAVQGLTKTFKDFWLRTRAKAVDSLSFEVRRGEIFGLLGPNGSGKSTTIKILLGLLRQSAGRVAVFGRLPSDVAVKKRIGYLPEESYLYPFLNARETLDYYAKLFRLDRAVRQRRIDELLEMVGLDAVQHRQVREYSKGMQRRIGLAQALINDPELLILDEPTTGLDPIGTRQVKDLILELGRRGKTVVLSSHLLADVEDCVDRMIILYGGKKQEEGTCDDLLASDDRSVIETDTLDENVISEIDALIRARTGGTASIHKVSRARQRLEDKFVGIVQRAVTARVETSGAQHSGSTASFLKALPDDGDAQARGEELIRTLTAARSEAAAAAGPAPSSAPAAGPGPAPAPSGPDPSLIGSLLAPAPAPAAPAPGEREPRSATPGAPAPAPAAPEVDRSMIGALLGEQPPVSDDRGTPPPPGGRR